VRIVATDGDELERLIRCCTRAPFAFDRSRLVGDLSDEVLYLLPRPPFSSVHEDTGGRE
jgi:hypothetical protein